MLLPFPASHVDRLLASKVISASYSVRRLRSKGMFHLYRFWFTRCLICKDERKLFVPFFGEAGIAQMSFASRVREVESAMCRFAAGGAIVEHVRG